MSKKSNAPCKNCDGGTMVRKKKYVLGAGGAILRFLLMIPAAFMLLFGGLGLIGTGGAASSTSEARTSSVAQLKTELSQGGLSAPIIDDIFDNGIYNGDRTALSEEQRSLINTAEAQYLGLNIGTAGAAVGTAIAGGISVMLVVVGVIMMAIGFLIGIRKWRLICNQCGVSLNAA